MKKLFLILATFTMTMIAHAERITTQKAAQIASEFFQELYDDDDVIVIDVEYKGAYSEDSMQTNADYRNEIPEFYIFNVIGDNGYVIVSGDDSFPTIIGYSIDCSWPEDKNLVPEALGWALDEYSRYVVSVRNGETEMQSMTEWYCGTPNIIMPTLLTTKWNQHYPYNKYTPEIYPAKRAPKRFNGHYAAGCGSIATSQVINYWKKPEHPLERKSCYRVKEYVDGKYCINTYDVTLDPKNFYNYSNMPDSIDSTAVATPWMTEAEWESKGDEIGRFIRDVAYALNLGWTGWTGGGGSDGYSYEQALVQGFDFSLDAYTIALEGMSQLRNPEIMKQMKQCLDGGMPIICRGTDTGGHGGHVFVFDGYDSNNFVHVNWGWGGSCNNWFDPGFLLTNMYDTKQKRRYNFSLDNSITLNLHPRTKPETVHLDSRQIKPLSVEFRSSETSIEEKLLNDNSNKPVCYFDRNTSKLSEEFSSLSFLKNLGYDYDFLFRLTDESSAQTKTDTVRFYGKTIDTRWVDADVCCSNNFDISDKQDGLYTLSGSMRQVLGGETGEWKEASHESQIRFSGNDVIMNPSIYDSYWHAPKCYHHCDGNNKLLVHLDYKNNPRSLFVGDTLVMQVNVTGIATNAISYVDSKANTTAVLLLTYGEQTSANGTKTDTIYNNSKALNEFIGKSQTATGKTTLIDIKTLPKVFTKSGNYTLTYSWPAMGMYIKDEINVEVPTGVEKLTTPARNSTNKFVKDNAVYIQSNGTIYNINGNKTR